MRETQPRNFEREIRLEPQSEGNFGSEARSNDLFDRVAEIVASLVISVEELLSIGGYRLLASKLSEQSEYRLEWAFTVVLRGLYIPWRRALT